MVRQVHMVGIGGIGMSALAQLYSARGYSVSGSDREMSRITELLSIRGIDVRQGHDPSYLNEGTTLLVYSDAVPDDNVERVAAREQGIRELSYFEALGEATREGTCVVVSGTHGKTTVTAMLGKVLIDAGLEPTIIAGSILNEQGSNFVAGRPDLFVVEGCEYRRHFLHLHPEILIITNVELDHTDYYKDLKDVQDAFRELSLNVPETGTIITNTESGSIKPLLPETRANKVPYQNVTTPELLVPGAFHTYNAQAAKAAAYAVEPELHEKDIDHSLRTFTGTWRRFEYKGTMQSGALVYDDYAHHPTAIAGTLQTMRTSFPGKKMAVIFHPHLYSRTRDFFSGFVEALLQADEVYLLPIYAAREAPDEEVRSEALVDAIRERGGEARYVATFEEAENLLQGAGKDELLVTMGAGDVYRLAEALVA